MHAADVDDSILYMDSLCILFRGITPILAVAFIQIPQTLVNHVCVVQNAYVKRSQCTETWSDCMQRILPHYWSPHFWQNRTLFMEHTNQLTSVVPGGYRLSKPPELSETHVFICHLSQVVN